MKHIRFIIIGILFYSVNAFAVHQPVLNGDSGLEARTKINANDAELYNSVIPFITVTNDGDDKGLIVTEQFSIGLPGDDGREAVFGGGDSYPVPIAYHCTVSNTTGMTITSAIDVSTILQSDASSSTGLFNGTTTGAYILVGSDYRFGGVKAKIDILGTVEQDQVIAEYLQDTNIWTRAYYMVTDSDYPYTQKGNLLSSCSSCSEQWRFGFDPLNVPVAWEQTTLTINGTPTTKYWARFRVSGTITADPQIEQLKLHTNRFEINADGFTEYFGISRYSKTVNITIEANTTKNPANENVQIASGITVFRTDNEFANSTSDGLIITGLFPEGIDTSIPILLYIDWYGKSAGTGDVELELELVIATEDFVYDGTAAKVTANPVITSLDNELYKRQTSVFYVIAQEALPGDTVYGSLFRDATVGNLNDTYESNIVITGVNVIGHFWKP